MLFNNSGIIIKPLSQGILGCARIAHSLRRVKYNPSMTLSAENIGPGFGSLPANNMEYIKHKIEGSSPALNLTTGWQRG
jgi:hypothetical protein